MTDQTMPQELGSHRPFKAEESSDQLGKYIFSCKPREDGIVIGCIIVAAVISEDRLLFSLGGHTDLISAQLLLDLYTFQDGSPCGIEI